MFGRVIMKLVILKLGFLSHGLQLTFEHGLTSGKTLDYVYQNQPSGHLLFGKWLDKAFLQHPGWEAIRLRRANLERLLTESIREKPCHASILDIASGPGSYILSVVGREGGEAICQDLDPRWVAEGNHRAYHLGIASHVHFEVGDAFALDSLSYRPNIVVSSGFYDWMDDDEKVRESIRQVHRLLPHGGTFLLTIQCAHPDQGFVEDVFQDFNHTPLRMKMRSWQQLYMWLRESGFTIEKSLTDPQGYYCVIKAIA